MQLPDLSAYKSKILQSGIPYPLKSVAVSANGLLGILPPADSEKTDWPFTTQTNPEIYRRDVNWPKITIVTPSYNQSAFLEQTIRSVLLQNYPNLEYIVIDGGSTDGSIEILKKYAPWISYWQSKKDEGQGQAINMGFSLASGSYYAWINSDDYYLPNVLHKVAFQFLNTGADFVYGYAYNYKIAKHEFELYKMLPLLDYFIKIPTLAQPSCFWSSKIHQPIWEELHCALDYELWLRLVKGHSRKQIKEPLSVANVHDDAKTSNPLMKQKWHDDHVRMWSDDAHGTVHEWKRVVFLNRIRLKLFKLLRLI